MATSFTSAGVVWDATNSPGQSAGSGSSNVLDDYEEGSWTPTNNGGSSISAIVNAFYMKIGASVQVHSYLNHSGASTAQQSYGGFPFVGIDDFYPIAAAQSSKVGPAGMVLRMQGATNTATLYENSSTDGQTSVIGNQVTGGHMMISMAYFTTF